MNDVYGRVRDVLENESSEQPDGVRVFEHMTQKDIASRVGCSREMISRIFKDLKAGEYILKDKSIPRTDRFSYSQIEIPFIGQFILSQYWLSQVVLYGIYALAGPGGLVVMRAFLFTGVVLLLWTLLRGKGLFFSLFVLGAYTAYMLYPYQGVRPALFTLLFSTVLLRLVAGYLAEGRKAFLVP